MITKTIRQVKGLLGDLELDKAKLRHERLILVEKLDIVKALDQQILETVKDEELEKEIERADEVREQIELTIVHIDTTLESPPPTPTPRSHSLEEPGSRLMTTPVSGTSTTPLLLSAAPVTTATPLEAVSSKTTPRTETPTVSASSVSATPSVVETSSIPHPIATSAPHTGGVAPVVSSTVSLTATLSISVPSM